MQGARAGRQGNTTDSLIPPLNFASLCLRWIGGGGNMVGSGMGKFGLSKAPFVWDGEVWFAGKKLPNVQENKL